MVITLGLALVTYVPLLWFVRDADGMPDPGHRDLLMRQEASRQTGGLLTLTAAERKLDAYLHRLKEQEMSAAHFPPALHFFRAKPLIQKSSVFKLLQDMPKGDAFFFLFFFWSERATPGGCSFPPLNCSWSYINVPCKTFFNVVIKGVQTYVVINVYFYGCLCGSETK